MTLIKPVKFISVEGFWEKPIHDARVEEAAEKLLADPNAFAIATATHAPPSCISFTNEALGKYSAYKLIHDYNISPMRIIPAYLFDQPYTYTIIDAYSNAIAIGWVSCGLVNTSHPVSIELSPVTAGFLFQWQRILELNTRSLQVLKNLSVNVAINPPNKILPTNQMMSDCQEEATKLLKIREHGGVIETGSWDDGSGVVRNFDNLNDMRYEIFKAFQATFGNGINYEMLFHLNDLERIIITFLWNIKSNSEKVTEADWDDIYQAIGRYFNNSISSKDFTLIKERISKMLHGS